MWLPPVVPATFVQRDNRFCATVSIDGMLRPARVASSGRMSELLVPGRQVWLAPRDTPHRRTAYDLLLVQLGELLVSVDAHLPNRLWAEHIRAHGWHGIPAGQLVAEQRYGDSRLDFCLYGQGSRTWMEVKSVTLVRQGCALFPDAPTQRGTRHLHALAQAAASGDRAAAVFVVQRADAALLAPNAEADPAFARALAEAQASGVEIVAYVCEVSLDHVTIAHPIPVCASPPASEGSIR